MTRSRLVPVAGRGRRRGTGAEAEAEVGVGVGGQHPWSLKSGREVGPVPRDAVVGREEDGQWVMQVKVL